MRNSKIGHIILQGGTIEELQNAFPSFPSEHIRDYLIGLGYAKSTANNYSSLLKSNAKRSKYGVTTSGFLNKSSLKNPSTSTNSNLDVVKKEYLVTDQNILDSSAHANFDNILVDTCALAFSDCLEIIEKAKLVTFIFSTLEEMDKKGQHLTKILKHSGISPRQSQLNFLAYNIREYTRKILSNPDKFMLSNFSGYPDTNYTDNALLQYLSILPYQIRPTLLTADKNLLLKANAMNLDYIGKRFVSIYNSIVVKDFKLGLKIYENENTLYVYYSGNFQMEILHDKKTIRYHKDDLIPVVPGDLIYLYCKNKNSIDKKTFTV